MFLQVTTRCDLFRETIVTNKPSGRGIFGEPLAAGVGFAMMGVIASTGGSSAVKFLQTWWVASDILIKKGSVFINKVRNRGWEPRKKESSKLTSIYELILQGPTSIHRTTGISANQGARRRAEGQ